MIREQGYPIIKIGVVGIAWIANRFPKEDKYVSGISLEGVYNPHGDHAKEYVNQYEFNFWEDDYDWFLEKLDAVYIASPYDTHYGYTKAALKQGKHVLCKKPFVLQKAQAEELFQTDRTGRLWDGRS